MFECVQVNPITSWKLETAQKCVCTGKHLNTLIAAFATISMYGNGDQSKFSAELTAALSQLPGT